MHQGIVAVGAPEAVFRLPVRAAFPDRAVNALDHLRAIVRMDPLLPPRDVPADLLGVPAEDLVETLGPRDGVAVEVAIPERFVRGPCRDPVALGGPAQLLVELALDGEVAKDLAEPDQPAALAPQSVGQARGPEPATVLPDEPALVASLALGGGEGQLALGHAGGPVLGGEDLPGVAPDELTLAVAEQALDTDVPAQVAAVHADQEHRVIPSLLDQGAEQRRMVRHGRGCRGHRYAPPG